MSDIVESDPYALPPENLSAIHPYAILVPSIRML